MDILEQNNTSSSNSDFCKENVNLTVELYKSECLAVTTSIAKLTKEIEAYADILMPINAVLIFENIIARFPLRFKT